MRKRLDLIVVERRLVTTRSQAESYIRLGKIRVDGRTVTKPGHFVSKDSKIEISNELRYVSRAGLKLASIAQELKLDFKDKTMLDVGSSTGGFTDFALQHGAKRVVAVDVGTEQLHPSLRKNPKIELHEKTDIRDFSLKQKPDIVVIDVSFISLRQILPHIAKNLSDQHTQIVAMVKPQFEAGKEQVNKGVIKNDTIRREILKEFEAWTKKLFFIQAKADSEVSGMKGNQERFYLLQLVK